MAYESDQVGLESLLYGSRAAAANMVLNRRSIPESRMLRPNFTWHG